jgi:AcrR family transcriptional regulator
MPATAAKRPYRMTARADAAEQTAQRILDAATAVFWERPTDQIPLDEVARRAGVTKQTILRRFGTKDGLVTAAWEHNVAKVRAERDDVARDDVAGAVRALVAHYERIGDAVLRMLAEEDANPGLKKIADRGRAYHAHWCARVFPSALGSRAGAARERRLAQLVAVTDVLTWKLMRRDRGLNRSQTELALRELLEPLAGGHP